MGATFTPALIASLRSAGCVVALTGAGVSAESGVATFRDALTGLWAGFKPEELASREGFARDPQRVWDWYAERRARARDVDPNPGHFALADMARFVPDFWLFTQNVDGLHARAGSPRVVELHGNIDAVKCFDCDRRPDSWTDAGQSLPRCPSCGGLLRPDVVWFGEALPANALDLAWEKAHTCQVFLSIGTSGLVQPAASLAFEAKRHGALLVEINLEPSPLTAYADYAFQDRSGVILPALVRAAWGGK